MTEYADARDAEKAPEAHERALQPDPIDNGASSRGQSRELRGQTAIGPQDASEAQSAELTENDPSLDDAREALDDLRAGRYVSPFGLSMDMEPLLERTDAPAKALLAELQAEAEIKGTFWDSGTIQRGVKVIDAHRTGTDALDAAAPGLTSYIVEARSFAKVAGDTRLTALERDLDALSSFYITANIYGRQLGKFSSYIQQMIAFIEAGQPVDHQQYWETQFWLPDIFKHVLEPHIGDSLLKDSAALGRFATVQNDFIALEARMKALGGDNPYAHTTRGQTKAELMAIETETPAWQSTGDRDQDRAAFQETLDRADEVLAGEVDVWPGDIHGIIQRLEMMRDHGPYSWSHEDVDRRLGPLRTLFDETKDPEAVSALHGDSADSMDVTIDPAQPMSVSVLGGVLRALANEPGEKGAFKFSLAGEISSGWAYAKGWAELEFFFTVTDTMTCVLGFDAAAAVGAGITLGGLVNAGIEVGGGYSMKARFGDPEEVASWIIGQMAAINEGVGRRIFPVGGGRRETTDPVVLSEVRGFAGAEAGVDVGVASAGVEGKAQASHTTYSQGGEEVTTGTAYEKSLTVGGMAKLTPSITASGSYTFTAQNVVRDMNTANEGEYHNHTVELGMGLSALVGKNTTAIKNALPPSKLQDGVLDFFGVIEAQLPAGMLGGVPLAKLHGTFDLVVAKLYESIELGSESRAGLDVTLRFEWNNVKEGGEYRNQYFRIAVTPRLTYGTQQVGDQRQTGASVSANKSEVVFETVGSETYSYVFQRYAFAWDRAQWTEFVEAQRDEVEALVHNMATQGRPAYDEEFARMLTERTAYPEGTFEEWLAVLESFFDTKRDGVIRTPGGS